MRKKTLTVADLQGLLAQEEQAIQELRRKRQALAAILEELAGVVSQLRGGREAAPLARVAKKPVRRARRRRRGTPLREIVAEILQKADKPMRAAEIAEQLPAAGYTTRSKNPKNMISVMLAQSKDFRRVGKGLYTLRKRKGGEKAK
jgi:ABC-type transporter Mla subunit MlaD